MTSRQNGYLSVLAAIFIFSVQDAISKHLGGLYSPVFITMIRYWAFALFVVAMAARTRGGLKAAVSTKRPVLQCLRGVLLAAQIMLVIRSFTIAGLAHSQAIFASGPIFVALLSMPLLGERVGWRRWTAIAVGLCGVLLILKPGAGFIDPDTLVPILAAIVLAIYVIVTRLVSRDDAAMTSFFYIGVAGAVMMSAIGPFFWTTLAPFDWFWMACLCITGTCSHFFLIRAYTYLDAAEVQPLTYLQLVIASITGVFLFGETLTLNMIAGSAIVVGAGIFTVWRESVVSRRTRHQAPPPPASV